MGAEATLKMLLLGEDRSAGKALKGVGDQAEKTHSKLAGVAHTASVALAGGLLAAGAAAIKLTKNAADDEAAASKLAQTMQKAAGATKGQVAATEDWITAQGKAYGVTDDELRPALSKLVVATHDVGKAQHLASLAMDVSAGTGKDLGAVSAALAKAQNGNVGALGRLGIATKDADGKTKSLHQITKDLAATYGGAAAKAADTTAGKQKILTTELSEAGETIGYKLLPFMLKLTDAATAALGWMEEHSRLVTIIAAAVGGLAVAVIAVNTAVRIWTAVQTALDVVLSANPIGLVVLAIAALVAGFVLAYKNSETFRNIVNGAFHLVAGAVGFLMDHWKLLITLILGPFGAAIVFIVDHFNTVKSVAHTVFKFVVDAFLTVVGALIDGAAKAFGWVPGIGPKLKSAADAFDNFRDRVNAALDGIHSQKDIHLNVTTKQSVEVSSINKPRVQYGGSATGARFLAAGPQWVGERGPELAWFPRGTSITTAADSARMMSGGGSASDGVVAASPVVLKLDSRNVWQGLLQLKRVNGNLELGLA